MARTKDSNDEIKTTDYRHRSAKRKNIPPAKIAGEGKVPQIKKTTYHYSAHLSPKLRFDATGKTDRLRALGERIAKNLSSDEKELFENACVAHEPWLEWAGKKEEDEKSSFEVDPVVLHIHERISTQAILSVAKRENPQRDLFADPELPYQEQVRFYQYDIDWANRLIIGDSLQVMASLSNRENLAGKVQMIYIDPPYGIQFRSNFQPEVGTRDVKEKDSDLTREPEMVRAYRDTWNLGVHSYLSYLRDRLVVAASLLLPTGSIFVQISDENLHRARILLDEVLGPDNFVSVISFNKNSGLGSRFLATANDFILWYAKDKTQMKYRQLFEYKAGDDGDIGRYTSILLGDGSIRSATAEERKGNLPPGAELFTYSDLTKPGPGSRYEIEFEGRKYKPEPRWWGYTTDGLTRAMRAGRIVRTGPARYRLAQHL